MQFEIYFVVVISKKNVHKKYFSNSNYKKTGKNMWMKNNKNGKSFSSKKDLY